MKLTDRDFIEAAERLECEVAVIKAVDKVESNGSGFLPDGQVKILFEAHHFARFTGGKFNVTHPRISSPVWNRKLYIGGSKEHYRLQQAVELDREAALKSTSWGRYQIMGFNYAACGFDSVQKFVNAMVAGERQQLDAFVTFILSQGMAPLLRGKKWKSFAKRYNGPGYAANKYDVKLEQAYKSFLN